MAVAGIKDTVSPEPTGLHGADQEEETDAGNRRAARAHQDATPRPFHQQAERNAAQVQQPCGDDEANRVGHRICGLR